MRPKTILGGLFVVTILIAAFALINAGRKSDAVVPQQQVIASTVELTSGTLLRAQDITWQPIAMAEADQIVQPSAAQIQVKPDIVEETAASLYGAVVRHPVAAGKPIRRGDIVKPGDRDFLQVVLTPGARAIAIPVTTGGASTGLLTPGDRVDVVLTQNFSSSVQNAPITRRSVGETVVQNLRVLAINSPDSKPGSATNAANGNFGRTVTMEVTPEQAETINVASELGKLTVTLRSNHDVASLTDEDRKLSYDDWRKKNTIQPKWAGDVSPALFGAAQPKPEAIKPKPITIIRGHSREVIEPDQDK